MNERPRADLRTAPGGFHLQASKLLVVALVVAAAATGALIIALLVAMPSSGPPPGPRDGGPPPPPPDMQSLVVFQLVAAFFVLAWLAVLVAYCRDQILRQVRQTPEPPPSSLSREELDAVLADLRAELAGDRAQELHALSERLEELTGEYGERRETDGYLNGMRTATMNDPPDKNVRSLRRTPPPR